MQVVHLRSIESSLISRQAFRYTSAGKRSVGGSQKRDRIRLNHESETQSFGLILRVNDDEMRWKSKTAYPFVSV